MRRFLATAALLAPVSCGDHIARRDVENRTAQSTDSTAIVRALRSVLALAMFDAPEASPAYTDSLACYEAFASSRNLALAHAAILGMRVVTPDSVVVTVVARSAAHEELIAGASVRWRTTVRERIDTLHFPMTRDSARGWRVCGGPTEGFGLTLGGRDDNSDYEPRTANRPMIGGLVARLRAQGTR